jgi:outer membrane lipoprotein SlyB
MKKLSLVATLMVVLPLSTFVVACDSGEDTDARAALEKEALERELDLALQPDTTAEPELADVAIEQPEAAPAPPAAAPRQTTTPRQSSPPRQTAPRPSTPTPAPAPEPTRPRTVTLSAPAGSTFAVRLNEEVSTRSHAVGETFTATLSEPLIASNGTTLVPAGATVRGQVTESRKSGRAGEEAYIGITFTSVSYDGNTYPIDASTVNVPSRLVSRDSNVEKVAKVGGGAAIGAIVGRVIGGGTKGTIAGAAVGAAAGTAVAMGTADVDRVIPAGSQVTVRLDSSVRVEKVVS